MAEMLTTVAVTGVLTAVAVPSMHGMVQTQYAASFAARFVGSLNLARSEGIKRNGRVVVCKSIGGEGCTTQGGWEQGWIVFHDGNNNASLDDGEWVVQRQVGVPTRLRMTGNQPVANYVSYGSSGTAKLKSGAFQAGTFTLCPGANTDAPVRKIILSGTGRPRLYPGVAADCVGG